MIARDASIDRILVMVGDIASVIIITGVAVLVTTVDRLVVVEETINLRTIKVIVVS